MTSLQKWYHLRCDPRSLTKAGLSLMERAEANGARRGPIASRAGGRYPSALGGPTRFYIGLHCSVRTWASLPSILVVCASRP